MPKCKECGIALVEGYEFCTDCEVIGLRARVAELEAGIAEIGCRTDHGNQPEPCPICAIVDRLIK